MKNITKIKNKILIILMTFAILMCAIPFSIDTFNIGKTYAYTPTQVNVDNGDFSSTTTSTYPKTASSWSKVNGSANNSSIKAGVVSTVLDTFKEQYKKYGLAIENTSGLENSNNLNVYMINALNTSMRYGISSSNIALEAESYYKISIDVKTSLPVLVDDATMNLSSMASIYLNVDDETYNFIGIDTNNAWDTYTFYLKTNKFVAPSVSVELWLGSKIELQSSGAVWFDNVKITRYSADTWKSKSDANNKIIDIDDAMAYDATNKIDNASFEDINAVWDLETNEANNNSNVITGITGIGNNYNSIVTNITANPMTNGKVNNDYALFINNTEKAGTVFKSNTFTIEKYTNYLIQVYVKTGSFDKGGATISLVPTNEDLSATTFTSVVTGTSSNSITNNWALYSFYVQGSPFTDEEVCLKLGVGSLDKDDLVKGYAFFDDVTISKIDYNKYANASTSATIKKAQLHNISSTSNFTNAYFNLVDDAFTGTYPLAPSGWTAKNSDNTENSGIISTKVADFESKTATYYGNLPWYCVGFTPLQTNHDVATADNNLLMIHNVSADYQTYTSSTYTMKAGTYYKLSIDARTLTSGKAFIKVYAAGNLVANYSFNSDDEWLTFEKFISTGLSDKDIYVEIGLGTSDNLVSGYAFFDNVIIKEINEDAFNAAKEADASNTLDYTVENFTMITGEENGELETPSNWSTSGSGIETMIGIDTSESENNLTITTMKANANITSTSSISYNLDSETYYLVTFKIKTSEFKDLENSGARFGFTESSKVYFENIVNNTEDYVEYKFYVSGANYSTITPYLELDIVDGISSQFVKLNSITIEKSTEAKFIEISDALENDDTITDCLVLGEVIEEESESGESTNYVGGNFDWYYIPTIITTLAFILAIIGVFINRRKKKAKKREKQKKFMNNYDREITLHKAIIDREAEAIRKKKLDELREKLESTNAELEQIESDYKENLAKENTNKQHEFKKYAKNRKKVADRKEQLEAEKEYVQSDAFMQETTNKVIETYEVEEHEKEVEEMAKLEPIAEETKTANDDNSKQENDETIEVEIEEPDEDKQN